MSLIQLKAYRSNRQSVARQGRSGEWLPVSFVAPQGSRALLVEVQVRGRQGPGGRSL